MLVDLNEAWNQILEDEKLQVCPSSECLDIALTMVSTHQALKQSCAAARKLRKVCMLSYRLELTEYPLQSAKSHQWRPTISHISLVRRIP